VFRLIDAHWTTVGHDVLRRALDVLWAYLDHQTDGGEERYMEAVRGLPCAFLEDVSRAFGELLIHFCRAERFEDVLGSVYMEMRSARSKAGLGQYFTPWNVCLAMAEIQTADLDADRLQVGPAVTVCDPCVGSGSMLLAVRSSVAARYGRKALQRLKVYGQDLDPLCVTMAKIQLRMTDDLFMTAFLAEEAMELRQTAKQG